MQVYSTVSHPQGERMSRNFQRAGRVCENTQTGVQYSAAHGRRALQEAQTVRLLA